MKKKVIRQISVALGMSLCLIAPRSAKAADQFITFQPQAETWQLTQPTIGYAAEEHTCVQLASTNLQNDFLQVTGQKPALNKATPTILIGTVGVNKQIDAWVKQGLLKDLKGNSDWVLLMRRRKRKTLVICPECHKMIHSEVPQT